MRLPRIRSAVLAWAGVATFALAACGWADDYTNHVGITLGGGAYKLVGGNLDHTRLGPWAQIGWRWGWRRHWDIEGNYRYGYNWDDTQNFRATTSGVDIGTLYSWHPDSRFTPQVFGGTGVLWFNVDDFRGQPNPGLFSSGRESVGFNEAGYGAHLNDSNWKLYGGVGFEYELMPKFTLRGLLRIDYLYQQDVDNTGASDSLGASQDPTGEALKRARANVDANNWMPAVAMNLTYFFGDRDSDGDGVANRVDKCIYEPEDRDGFQDEDGCPDPDNDGDGIADAQDKCPDKAEDKDGYQDEDGCPDLDNDGDGIEDAQDKCPMAAEDKDGFQDEDGCPDFDNDGDAVPDSLDQCADTAKGARVDEKGCPLSAEESQLLATGAIRLQDVRFETGKATLVPETTSSLDEVGNIMAKYPALQIEIGGHTDSSGSAGKNQTLSQERAQAVLDYIKTKFPALDTSKYQVKGYGASAPVADNKTDEGRAQNRRVEFKVLNPEALQKKPE